MGATALQSSLYAIGQTIIWEYVWEGGMVTRALKK